MKWSRIFFFALFSLMLASCDPLYTVQLYNVNHTAHTLYLYRKASGNTFALADTLQPQQKKYLGHWSGICLTPQKYLSMMDRKVSDTELIAIDHPDSIYMLIGDDHSTGSQTVYFDYREAQLKKAVRYRMQP